MTVENGVPRDDALLGLVRAENVSTDALPPGFEAVLAALLARRQAPLDATEEAARQAARDLLRNGRYKPTGRGKPASEYLIRAAADPERDFPRINAPVDVCNYVSLKTLLPISLWDLELANTDDFRFRLGRAGETYVFNTGGQEIDLEDLIVGCRVVGEAEAPIVNPVKDSLATKTTDETRRVAACIYAPAAVVTPEALAGICAEFAQWLAGCGEAVETAFAVAEPGRTAVLR